MNQLTELCDVLEYEPMSKHTTYRVGGKVRYFVYPKNETGNPTLEKEVKESQSSTGKTSEYGSYATASAGDIVEYKIQSTRNRNNQK